MEVVWVRVFFMGLLILERYPQLHTSPDLGPTTRTKQPKNIQSQYILLGVQINVYERYADLNPLRTAVREGTRKLTFHILKLALIFLVPKGLVAIMVSLSKKIGESRT